MGNYKRVLRAQKYIYDKGIQIPAVFLHYSLGMVQTEMYKYKRALNSNPPGKHRATIEKKITYSNYIKWLAIREKELKAKELLLGNPIN